MKEESENKYIAYFDGACQPNPGGTAAYGAVIYKDDELVCECPGIYRPEPGHERETSSNLAEYLGFVATVEWFIEQGLFEADITVRGDSKLVIEQMFGNWKIKEGTYVPLAKKARVRVARLKNSRGEWIPRDQNEVADRLCQAALERAGVNAKLKKSEKAVEVRTPANDNVRDGSKLSAKAVKAG